MKLSEMKSDLMSAWLYLERNVNKGSPSGFGGLNESFNVGKAYNPFYDNKPFFLNYLDGVDIEDFGAPTDTMMIYNDCFRLFLHPEMASKEDISDVAQILQSNFKVISTASSRTVYTNNIFVKLHYDNLIGRVNRSISRRQSISSVELTSILEKSIRNGNMPSSFYFMREPYAKSIKLKNNYEVSCVFRETAPYPHNPKLRWVIPVFSLFSKDKYFPSDELILKQLVDISGNPPESVIIESIIEPIIANYFSAIINCGLQFEIQAQNSLLALDEGFNILGVVFRDLESVDKDIQLIADRNLPIYSNTKDREKIFASYPYKCIWYDYRPEQEDSYAKKHSFMFDFKLGEYVLKEIVDCSVALLGLDEQRLNKRIRDIVRCFTKKLPADFFPVDTWYYYDNIVLDRKEDNNGKTPLRPFKPRYDIKYR